MLGNPYLTRRAGRGIPAALAAAALAFVAALAAGPAHAQTAHAQTAQTAGPAQAAAADACDIVSGELTWGFKESFRAYISGTIAHGEWTTFDGATYTTPQFGWSGATGVFDPDTATGEASFPGGIRFTGHDGLLDTTVAAPTLRFAGDGTAQLLVDLTSVSMEDALAGNADAAATFTRIAIVDLDLGAAPLQAGDGVVSGTGVPTAITAEGFEAFGNYEPGTAFDPLTFTLAFECAAPSPTPTPTPTPTVDEAGDAAPTPPATATDTTWMLWTFGALVLAAAIALIAWIALRGRRRAAAAGSTGPGANGTDPAANSPDPAASSTDPDANGTDPDAGERP